MTEDQYQSICKACDRVLLDADATVERVAIPWLHVIREHPVIVANYAELFKQSDGFKALIGRLSRGFNSNALRCRELLRALGANGQPWFGPEDLPQSIDILFVSHLLNRSQIGQKDDFYFGGLHDEIVSDGHTAVIALINHSGQPAAECAGRWKEHSVPRVVFAESLGIRKEFSFWRRLKMESRRLRGDARNMRAGLLKQVLFRASEEAFSSGSFKSLLIAAQIGSLLARLQPKVLILTHEGHAWERMAFAAAHSALPRVRCIGYQQTTPFRLQHAVRRSLLPQYNPDHILTSGRISKEQMEREPRLKGIPVSVLGSNRISKEHTVGIAHPPVLPETADKPACLVIPEGLDSECNLLFEFSLACAQIMPDVRFIWRLHPSTTYKLLAAHNPKLKQLPENIVLSKSTLDEDIGSCHWALYRGTTAIVQAVVAGLRPIYLALPCEMTIDPLYELKGWRIKVKTIFEFKNAIDIANNMGEEISESEMQRAKAYCEQLYTQIDVKVLSQLTELSDCQNSRD